MSPVAFLNGESFYRLYCMFVLVIASMPDVIDRMSDFCVEGHSKVWAVWVHSEWYRYRDFLGSWNNSVLLQGRNAFSQLSQVSL